MTPINEKENTDFNLEKAITLWKRSLRGLQAVQGGDIAELEGYLRDKVEELTGPGTSEEEAFQKAASEFSDLDELDGDYYRARTTRFGGRPPWQPPRFIPALLWNYIKIYVRKFRRQKVDSTITLAGLTMGMAAFLLILVYCGFERSYDDFHRNGDRIFRVQNDRIISSKRDQSAGCPPGLGPALKEEFSEIAEFTRLLNISGDSNIVARVSSTSEDAAENTGAEVLSFYERRIFFADPSFFQIFSFPLVQGDADTALEEPNAVVLTESTAQKYFAGEDPLGQTISVTTVFGQNDFRVSGICRDIPSNSHLRFDILLSFRGLEVFWPNLRNQTWSSNAFLTYILLSPFADSRSLEAKFPLLIEKYSLESVTLKREFHLQSLQSIHLTSKLRFEPDVNGDIKTVKFLEIIGIFILLIAWANSINLATARSMQRGKEVCIRKTLGAKKRQLARQFLFESLFINILAFLLAIGIILTVFPFLSRLVGKPLSLDHLGAAWIWVSLSIFAGALLSGLYPAFVLSSFRPVLALRSPAKGVSRGAVLRKALVLFQFTIAILLIASTLIVGKQLAFMQNQDIGVDLDRILVLKIPQLPDSGQLASIARFQMSRLAQVHNAAVSTSLPGRDYTNNADGIRRQTALAEEAQSIFFIDVDEYYFQMFHIPILHGRTFSEGYGSDQDAVVISEEAVKLLGFESGEKAILQNIVAFGDIFRIIGVAKNYHHISLREKIEPIIYLPLPMSYFKRGYFLSLKIEGPSLGPAVSAINAKWKEIFPGQPFEYFFLDDAFNSQYDADKLFGRVFGLLSLLAILISCLGLFGLASFSAERRNREIGIRKVFGASAPEITRMLAGEFVRWVLLANLIALPVTWIIMSQWIQRFAYRTAIDLWTLGLASLISLVVALATVSYKVARSAAANPVDSIMYE